MDSPLISIILPTYNGSKYIRTSIESCLRQTLQNFELIIVNDCSTDDTLSIAKEYAATDSRIKIISNTHNKKLPLSLNTGFENAKGKYHTWTSDDNYYSPQALQILCDILEKDEAVDLVYTDYSIINDRNEVTGSKTFNNIYDSFFNWLGCGACFLYKSKIFVENNGYDPSAFLIEDYDFFMRAFIKFRFYYLHSYDLYFYREHADSLTSTRGDMVNYMAKMMVERQMNRLEEKLSKKEIIFLYRKFAIFNAVQKNNIFKYELYLNKLWKISKKQSFATILYVPFLKTKNLLSVSFSGFMNIARLLFKS